MFERLSVTGSGAGRHPRVARADRVSKIRTAELRIEAMVLRDAAGWAGEHGVDLDDPFATGPAGGVGRYVGSHGTPWIDEHVAKEYGALRGTSTWEATELIIDALDLRHRFPRLWRAIHQLKVRVWIARKISKACRELSREAAALIDAELARKASWGLPRPRLSGILTAAIINADPERHKAKLAAAKFDRRVWLSPDEDGIRTLVIKADQGDQILLYALIDRIAEILLLEGDTDPVDVRRAKAAGWLARPEDLVVLLYRHAGGTPPPASGDPATSPTTHHDTDPGNPADPAAASATPGEPDAGTDPDTDRDDDHRDRAADHGNRSTGTADPDSADHGNPNAQNSNTTDDPATTTPDTEPANAEPGDAEPSVPQPPPDYPDYDWDAPEPPWNPGASDHLPPPRSRWHGTDHLPGPEPSLPAWCYQPPDDEPPPPDLGPPGSRVGCDVPRLVDYLTTKGLKPARPRVIMNVHLTDQTLLTGDRVVRSDEMGPILLSQLIDLLKDHHCQISLRPILDPANLAAVDAYEIPETLRAAVRTRHPASVFPFSSRHGKHLELDHTVPHTKTAEPPGQTRVGNLGPLAHPEYQAKTDGVWHVEQPHPGVFLWRSPHQHYFLVTNQGTQALGRLPAPRPVVTPLRVLTETTQTRETLTTCGSSWPWGTTTTGTGERWRTLGQDLPGLPHDVAIDSPYPAPGPPPTPAKSPAPGPPPRPTAARDLGE